MSKFQFKTHRYRTFLVCFFDLFVNFPEQSNQVFTSVKCSTLCSAVCSWLCTKEISMSSNVLGPERSTAKSANALYQSRSLAAMLSGGGVGGVGGVGYRPWRRPWWRRRQRWQGDSHRPLRFQPRGLPVFRHDLLGRLVNTKQHQHITMKHKIVSDFGALDMPKHWPVELSNDGELMRVSNGTTAGCTGWKQIETAVRQFLTSQKLIYPGVYRMNQGNKIRVEQRQLWNQWKLSESVGAQTCLIQNGVLDFFKQGSRSYSSFSLFQILWIDLHKPFHSENTKPTQSTQHKSLHTEKPARIQSKSIQGE